MVKRRKRNEKTVREAVSVGRGYQIFDTDVQGISVTIYPTGNRALTLYYRAVGRHRPMPGEPRIGTCHGQLKAVMPVDLQLWRARGKQPLQANVRKGPRLCENSIGHGRLRNSVRPLAILRSFVPMRATVGSLTRKSSFAISGNLSFHTHTWGNRGSESPGAVVPCGFWAGGCSPIGCRYGLTMDAGPRHRMESNHV